MNIPVKAAFSPCLKYRFRLEGRLKDGGPTVLLVGVNPSTADETTDDQTVRTIKGFAREHGWSRFIIVNAFAFRATDVRELAHAADPRHPENEGWIRSACYEADLVVPCWGSRRKLPAALHPVLDQTLDTLVGSQRPITAFGVTASGDPRHPLMVAHSTRLQPYERPVHA
jgi:hypothetical protein